MEARKRKGRSQTQQDREEQEAASWRRLCSRPLGPFGILTLAKLQTAAKEEKTRKTVKQRGREGPGSCITALRHPEPVGTQHSCRAAELQRESEEIE
ncbi:hypothetical protein NDU88_002481 [Pleurodeles waltl]|uniref:Uncharacterized protein n=1 Tax=Pleurodeles waltl TaxID=8319 RepID=A0AAV7LPE5_PLEWA|nr:hypothetical protein NDU88_002481 [Pleurodeles waltl]